MTPVKSPVNRPADAPVPADTEPGGASAPKAHAPEGMGGLAKGLAIIEAFGATMTRMTVSDAARLADISRPAARRCLLTLAELGYVAHDGKFFHPLPRMLRLGSAYLSSISLPQLAQPLLMAARDELEESISLAVLDDGWSVFVARAEALRIVSTGTKLGGRLPAYCSATGRTLLADHPAQDVRRQIATVPLKKLTALTLTDPEAILEAIRRAAQDGYALSDEELEIGMRAMAVPVRNARGLVEAALSVSVFSARVSVQTMVEQFLPVLQRYAKRLERAL
jgi:IclR family pca regulon transcriptional regulator